jgi:hypothetical protein
LAENRVTPRRYDDARPGIYFGFLVEYVKLEGINDE